MKRMEPLSHNELISLLSAARETSTRDWCLLVLMFHHGLRASEVGSLLRSDVNERDWTLTVSTAERLGQNTASDLSEWRQATGRPESYH